MYKIGINDLDGIEIDAFRNAYIDVYPGGATCNIKERNENINFLLNELDKLNKELPLIVREIVPVETAYGTYKIYVKKDGKTEVYGFDKLVKRKTKHNPTLRVRDFITPEIEDQIRKAKNKVSQKYEEKKKEIIKRASKIITEKIKKHPNFKNYQKWIEWTKKDKLLENMNNEEKIKWLKENGYKGIKNLGYRKEYDDGFGHKCGYIYDIDHDNKEVIIRGYSSDD